MKILFDDLLSKTDRKKILDLSLENESFEFDGEEIKATEPIVVNGKVYATENIVVFEANIKSKLEIICSRCLGSFIYNVDIDIEERFTNSTDLAESGEVAFVNGDSIDVDDTVKSSIISTLPIQRICSDNCFGLCPTCGADLNNVSCKCNNLDTDLRFEKLKELFGE